MTDIVERLLILNPPENEAVARVIAAAEEIKRLREGEKAADAEIERLRKQRELGNAALREAEEWRKEIERLHGMLQICMARWIPLREVAFRKKIEEALGHE